MLNAPLHSAPSCWRVDFCLLFWFQRLLTRVDIFELAVKSKQCIESCLVKQLNDVCIFKFTSLVFFLIIGYLHLCFVTLPDCLLYIYTLGLPSVLCWLSVLPLLVWTYGLCLSVAIWTSLVHLNKCLSFSLWTLSHNSSFGCSIPHHMTLCGLPVDVTTNQPS